MAVFITSVEFRNYKALGHFSLSLQDVNILVGPNNCGKSTIIGAFRVLSAGLRRARSQKPERVIVGNNVSLAILFRVINWTSQPRTSTPTTWKPTRPLRFAYPTQTDSIFFSL